MEEGRRGGLPVTVKAEVTAGRGVDPDQDPQDQAVGSLAQDQVLDLNQDQAQDPGPDLNQGLNQAQDQRVGLGPDLGLPSLDQGLDLDQLNPNLVLLLVQDQVQLHQELDQDLLAQEQDQDQPNQAPDQGQELQQDQGQDQPSPDQALQQGLIEESDDKCVEIKNKSLDIAKCCNSQHDKIQNGTHLIIILCQHILCTSVMLNFSNCKKVVIVGLSIYLSKNILL